MYTEIEHTADYAIRVQSIDLAGLFLDSAHGMYSLTGGRVEGTLASRELRLYAADLETLLVEWLAELAFLLEVECQMASAMEIKSLQPSQMVAVLQTGSAMGVIRLIKAVTFHNLAVQPTARGYEATIVFDV